MRASAGCRFVACCAGGVLAARQAPPPVIFRSEVNYVELDAIVTDAQGSVVSDLTQADFEVLEDGKPQKLTTFSHVDLPIEKAERPLFVSTPIEPDVQTNRAVEGRVYLIVLDDLHTALMRTPRVRRTARQFIETAMGSTTWPRSSTPAATTRRRTSPATARCCSRRWTSSTGRKLASATLNKLDGATPRARARSSLTDIAASRHKTETNEV